MNKIVIVGHKNPDVDSILSGYLLCSYLRYRRYDADYVIPDDIVDEETSSILKLYSVDMGNFPGDILADSKLILVDHHETSLNNEVVAVIDHHPTIKEFNYPVYINKKVSSTTKHIYDIVNKECPQYISRRFMELVLLGMAVDTLSFRSSKALPGDKKWFIDMCKKYNLDSQKILEVGDCVTDISDIESASMHGYKDYDYFGKSIGTSYIQTRGIDIEKVSLILDILKKRVSSDALRMWVFIVTDISDSTSYVYKISKENIDIEKYDFIVSRGSDIMPKIEKLMLEEAKHK